MARGRACPACKGRMQQFYAEGVELDRCLSCGGLWFDGGELTDVLGRKLRVEPKGDSQRPCIACHAPMQVVMLAGGVEVDRCKRCNGVFLDDGEIDRLSSAAPQVAAQKQFLFFYCVDCGDRKSYEQGRPTARGRLCEPCFTVRREQSVAEEKDRGFMGALRRLFNPGEQ